MYFFYSLSSPPLFSSPSSPSSPQDSLYLEQPSVNIGRSAVLPEATSSRATSQAAHPFVAASRPLPGRARADVHCSLISQMETIMTFLVAVRRSVARSVVVQRLMLHRCIPYHTEACYGMHVGADGVLSAVEHARAFVFCLLSGLSHECRAVVCPMENRISYAIA